MTRTTFRRSSTLRNHFRVKQNTTQPRIAYIPSHAAVAKSTKARNVVLGK